MKTAARLSTGKKAMAEKNNTIKLQDGTDVKVGMKVFERRLKQEDYDNGKRAAVDPENYYPKMSGKNRISYVTHTVIAVNESANSRSFTIRSKKGCESTYTVKDTCVNDLFGSIKSVQKDHEKYKKSDIGKVKEKYSLAHNKFTKDKKDYNERLKKITLVIEKLKKIKPEFCDC